MLLVIKSGDLADWRRLGGQTVALEKSLELVDQFIMFYDVF